jgi:hypothetical protein
LWGWHCADTAVPPTCDTFEEGDEWKFGGAVKHLLQDERFASRLWACLDELFCVGGFPQALARIMMKTIIARAEESEARDVTQQPIKFNGLQAALAPLYDHYGSGKLSP